MDKTEEMGGKGRPKENKGALKKKQYFSMDKKEEMEEEGRIKESKEA